MNGSSQLTKSSSFHFTRTQLRSKSARTSTRKLFVCLTAFSMAFINIYLMLRQPTGSSSSLDSYVQLHEEPKLSKLAPGSSSPPGGSTRAQVPAASGTSTNAKAHESSKSSSKASFKGVLPKDLSLVAKEIKVIEPKSLPVFWINDDNDSKQRQAMEAHLKQLEENGSIVSTRVSAITKIQAHKMWTEKVLLLKDVILGHPSREDQRERHKRGEFVYDEAASLVSHLLMIQTAFESGNEYALFLNDKTIIPEEFMKHWKSYIALAPDRWRALQLATSNPLIRQQTSHMHDPWISWHPSHWSSSAFMLSREGMENILKAAIGSSSSSSEAEKEEAGGTLVWRIDESRLVLPDEVIFFLSRRAFTSTFQWFDIPMQEVLASESKVDFPVANLTQRIPAPLSERILVFTNIGVRGLATIPEEVERLRQDVQALSQWHNDCTWVVNVVVSSKSLLVQILKYLRDFKQSHGDIRIHPRVVKGNFNKFSFLKPFLGMLPDYDYFLIKDSDVRLSGFPWRTFLQRAQNAVISGALYETTGEALVRHSGMGKAAFSNGKWWKDNDPNSWESRMLATITPVSLPWIEMYFALLRADFAKKFFDQVLVDEVVGQPSDFGVDLMWCPAAGSFTTASKKQACQLVPLIASHDNTRQIQKTLSYNAATDKIKDFLWFSPKFTDWMKQSDAWRSLVQGKKVQSVITYCNSLKGPGLNDPFFDPASCAEENERLAHFNQQAQKEEHGVLLPENYLDNLYVYKRGG